MEKNNIFPHYWTAEISKLTYLNPRNFIIHKITSKLVKIPPRALQLIVIYNTYLINVRMQVNL